MSDYFPQSALTKRGFSLIIDEASRVLILGTMPSEESLRRQEYYGHPRNQFWHILSAIYQVPFAEAYPDRVALLHQKQLAVWDVLEYCERRGSLDQAIRKAVPNDFRGLFATYQNLRVIVLNGQKAFHLFEHRVLTQQALTQLLRWLMPSTSPAATMPLAEKIKRWSRIIEV